MRITFIVGRYWPAAGGVETLAHHIARQLALRHDVTVIAHRIDDGAETRLTNSIRHPRPFPAFHDGAAHVIPVVLPLSRRIPAFRHLAEAWKNPKVFHAWLNRHKPDVLFTLYNVVFDWLKAHGQRVPADIGVIQLEWRASRPEIAGMNQHNDVTGEAEVDLVVSQIHNNEHGVPAFPRATLIGATWMDGTTVKNARAALHT